MQESIKIVLPLPNKRLSSNKKDGRNWTATYYLKQLDKAIGYNLTKQQVTHHNFTRDDYLKQTVYFIFKNRKSLDDDNAYTSFKNMRDGIFKALDLNDNRVLRSTIDKTIVDKLKPRVELILEKL